MGIFTKTKGVEWKGYIVKNSQRTDFIISHMICDALGRLTGNGKDQIGKYSIFGFSDQAGQFTFQKMYKKDKFNNENNPVFRGQYQSGFVSGLCTSPGMCEEFFLKITHGSFFAGHYLRTDIPHPLSASMFIQMDEDVGVFGLGCDHNGFYIVRGQKLKKDKEAKKGNYNKFFLTISYLGKFQIQHHAIGRKPQVKGGPRTLEGTWMNEALHLRGTFELSDVQPLAFNEGANDTSKQQILHQSMFGA